VKGGSMSFQELKQRHRQERDAQHSNLRLRVHRALSWLDRAEQAEDLDGRFIFLWIAFNGKRSINPVLADGFVLRKQRQKLASSSTAAALRNPRRSSPLAGVQGCGAARRRAPARWLSRFRSGCRSARWPWHPWACR